MSTPHILMYFPITFIHFFFELRSFSNFSLLLFHSYFFGYLVNINFSQHVFKSSQSILSHFPRHVRLLLNFLISNCTQLSHNTRAPYFTCTHNGVDTPLEVQSENNLKSPQKAINYKKLCLE